MGELGLSGELLLQLFDFTLLRVQERVAAPALCIDALLLLIVETTLSFDEFLHGLGPEIQDELIKALREVLIIESVFHVVHGCKRRCSQRRLGLTVCHLNRLHALLLSQLRGFIRKAVISIGHSLALLWVRVLWSRYHGRRLGSHVGREGCLRIGTVLRVSCSHRADGSIMRIHRWHGDNVQRLLLVHSVSLNLQLLLLGFRLAVSLLPEVILSGGSE